MDTKHTPGPWIVGADLVGVITDYRDANGNCTARNYVGGWAKTVCKVKHAKWLGIEESVANAHLIAAAPELLECTLNGWRMCNALILAAEQSGNPLPHDHYAVRDLPKFAAAIAKATGSAS